MEGVETDDWVTEWLDMLSVRMRIFGIFGVTMHANG